MMLINGTDELREVAQGILSSLFPRDRATVITLSGDLGAGKTAFAQVFAQELGVVEPVTSPTFIIQRVYPLSGEKGKGFSRLIHIDAYRLEGVQELESLGWKEITSRPENLVLLEWPERVAEIIPRDALRIVFTYVNETSRDIIYGNA